jgi:hypothetical protein
VSDLATATATSAAPITISATPPRTLADVGSLLVAPDEALRSRHLIDHGMTLAPRVGASVALLRLAAANVAAGCAEPEVEPAPAFLATIRLGLWQSIGNVVA